MESKDIPNPAGADVYANGKWGGGKKKRGVIKGEGKAMFGGAWACALSMAFRSVEQ